jgi:geranylgeranyl diphosphate synthase type II
MKRPNNILRVPSNPKVREMLRKEAAALVMGLNLLPPAGIEILEPLALNLIRKLDIADEYLNFAIVLAGNEAWRKIIAATPFNRRLLLLPQCLKNEGSCKGTMDELGLICAGCRGCVLDDVLNEAEKLGYTTLVAEGTAVAIGLVEEGSIDAVIGVSCMPVLQRSFDQVSKAAVPVIGLPLMYDGCSNTNLDYDWLLDEIRIFEVNPESRPLSVSLLKSKVQEYFTDKYLDSFFPETGIVETLAKEMMSLGGQRMRPLFSVLGYLSYSGSEDDRILSLLSMIIECFHKASLVHDDIEDNSDHRYDTLTLHKKHGISMAINAGDYLTGKGYMLLSGLPLNAGIISRCLGVISSSHVKLTQGQGADIMLDPLDESFTTEQATEIFKFKTGEAVKVALLLGAIAGEAPESEIEVLSRFSDSFGIAYQIRDDLNEFEEKRETEKINDFPILMALLNENAAFADPTEAIWREKNTHIHIFREKAGKLELVPKAANLLQSHISSCYAALDELRNVKLRLSLYGILGKIFK